MMPNESAKLLRVFNLRELCEMPGDTSDKALTASGDAGVTDVSRGSVSDGCAEQPRTAQSVPIRAVADNPLESTATA
jgi:hypothetical protein